MENILFIRVKPVRGKGNQTEIRSGFHQSQNVFQLYEEEVRLGDREDEF